MATLGLPMQLSLSGLLQDCWVAVQMRDCYACFTALMRPVLRPCRPTKSLLAFRLSWRGCGSRRASLPRTIWSIPSVWLWTRSAAFLWAVSPCCQAGGRLPLAAMPSLTLSFARLTRALQPATAEVAVVAVAAGAVLGWTQQLLRWVHAGSHSLPATRRAPRFTPTQSPLYAFPYYHHQHRQATATA